MPRRQRERTIWLTFDDGPHENFTPRVLDTLEAFDAKALFFLIGKNAKRHGGLAREIAAAGHRIGNHGWTHPDLRELAPEDVAAEITRTEDVLGDLLGEDKVFRPPFGGRNRRVNRVIRRCGYRTILWTVSTRDWDADYQPDGWVDLGLGHIRRRTDSLVLMHDVQASTARNLGKFLERIRAIGNTRFGAPQAL